jgi:heat shock protein HslJ
MKLTIRIFMALLLVGVIAGCCNCRSLQRKNQRPLVGTEWQLIQLGGVTMQPVEGKYTLQLTGEEQRVAAVGACNQILATYVVDDKQTLRIENPASTRMLCPDAETEAKFVEVLAKTTRYDMDGEMLLLFEQENLLAVFQAKK